MIKGDGSCALMMNEDGEIPADMGWEGFESVREIYIDEYGLAHVGNSRTAACHHVFHVEVEFAGFIFIKREKKKRNARNCQAFTKTCERCDGV